MEMNTDMCVYMSFYSNIITQVYPLKKHRSSDNLVAKSTTRSQVIVSMLQFFDNRNVDSLKKWLVWGWGRENTSQA